MPKTIPFDQHPGRYEAWFERHRSVYESELAAVRKLVPERGIGLEIGVGSGRFAEPLGIQFGVEPSAEMCKLADQRGISVVQACAEELPFRNTQFDFTLMVTTICFLDDAIRALQEARRVLRPRGNIIIGFVDKNSAVGKTYQEHKDENVFYRYADFYAVEEVIGLLRKSGFGDFRFVQTIYNPLDEINEPEPIEEGYGKGSFVVVSAGKR